MENVDHSANYGNGPNEEVMLQKALCMWKQQNNNLF